MERTTELLRRAEARVLVVGAGGLGCPASLALARAGVRRFTIVDPDRVEESNLHRQLWHRAEDLGAPKAASAAARLEAAFPGVEARPLEARLDADDALALFEAHALVIDGTDGIATKFLLSDAAVLSGVPLTYAGVLRWEGQAMAIRRGGPCLRCLFDGPPPEDAVPTCAQAGVLGSVAGVIGGIQAALALAVLDGAPAADPATLEVFDGSTLRGRQVRVRRASDCPACGPGRSPTLASLGAPRC